ncbi:hypothetical protein B0A55_08830 [Friedmanniomyces simplex]|uniref:Uncharacterized protein n=1 Tax=Friedmanniomyces simplex TaxID=329884 RepID=A0A4U0X0Y0_9PEZI|nr:hypothetical protein B0A55_08830 [Friedmanniomyces simplex]
MAGRGADQEKTLSYWVDLFNIHGKRVRKKNQALHNFTWTTLFRLLVPYYIVGGKVGTSTRNVPTLAKYDRLDIWTLAVVRVVSTINRAQSLDQVLGLPKSALPQRPTGITEARKVHYAYRFLGTINKFTLNTHTFGPQAKKREGFDKLVAAQTSGMRNEVTTSGTITRRQTGPRDEQGRRDRQGDETKRATRRAGRRDDETDDELDDKQDDAPEDELNDSWTTSWKMSRTMREYAMSDVDMDAEFAYLDAFPEDSNSGTNGGVRSQTGTMPLPETFVDARREGPASNQSAAITFRSRTAATKEN